MTKISKNKMQHSLAVGIKMEKIAKIFFPKDVQFQKDMFFLGYVHDIGYQYSVKPEEHAEKGYEILKNSNYEYAKEVKYHGKNQDEYNSVALELLNYADYTTDHYGNNVSVEDRVKSIGNRYGLSSSQYKTALFYIPHAHEMEEKINKEIEKNNILQTNKKNKTKNKTKNYNKNNPCYTSEYTDISKSETKKIIDNCFDIIF